MSRLADEFMIPRHRFSIDFVWNIFNMMTSLVRFWVLNQIWKYVCAIEQWHNMQFYYAPRKSVLFTIYERKSVWLILKIRFQWIGA